MRSDFTLTAQHRNLVTQAARVGIAHADICLLFEAAFDEPLSITELRAVFAEELVRAPISANFQVANALLAKALAGDTTAMIFWTKARMGWRDRDAKNEAANEPPSERTNPTALPDGRTMATILRIPRRSTQRSSG